MKTWTFALAVLAMLAGLTTVARAEMAPMDPFDHPMGSVAAQLVAISDALAADKTDGVKEAADAIVELAKTLSPEKSTSAHASHCKMIPAQLLQGAHLLLKAKSLQEARAGFKVISVPVVTWAEMANPAGYYVLHCGMAKASWLQKKSLLWQCDVGLRQRAEQAWFGRRREETHGPSLSRAVMRATLLLMDDDARVGRNGSA